MISLNYSLYDCFADEAFQGHVAAVVDVPQNPELSFASKIALELCQTITCFVWTENHAIWVKSVAKDGSFWSTNHGLLAVARHLLGNEGKTELHTSGGIYKVQAKDSEVSITLPSVHLENAEMPERLGQAFDIMPVSVEDTKSTCVVELRTVEEIVNIEPDMNRISKLDYDRIVLTAESNTAPFHYVCRCFAPKLLMNENSGSLFIQTFLPVFWQKRLGRDNFSFVQFSQRKSIGKVDIKKDDVEVRASVKQTFKGTLKV